MKKIIIFAALLIISFELYGVVWPVIDRNGVVRSGSYRNLKIGDTKAEILTELYSSFQKVRLSGYYVNDRAYVVPTLENPAQPLSASDKWLLIYPSMHKESIVLNFENNRVVAIEYYRNALEPSNFGDGVDGELRGQFT